MWQIRKILAPTDLSELSLAGLRYALEMAGAQGAEVVIYSVVDYKEAYPPPPEEAIPAAVKVRSVDQVLQERQENLDKLAREAFPELFPKVRTRLDVALGTPYENIVEKAAMEGADMIVMSTQGKTGLDRVLLGSVTEQVVRRAPCAVLSIRPWTAESSTQPHRSEA